MNEMTLFQEEEKTMTVKEVAAVLNVTPEAIKKHVRELFPELIKNGVTTRLNERQVTEIKQRMIPTTEVVGAVTDYEMELMTQKVIAYHIQKAREYKHRAELAESALNRIANGKGCFSMNQTAKALKLPYGNIKLYEKLRNEGILNKDNSPKQEQVNSGHFKVVLKYVSNSVGNKPVTLTTSKGLVYLARKFHWEIDESIKADTE